MFCDCYQGEEEKWCIINFLCAYIVLMFYSKFMTFIKHHPDLIK